MIFTNKPVFEVWSEKLQRVTGTEPGRTKDGKQNFKRQMRSNWKELATSVLLHGFFSSSAASVWMFSSRLCFSSSGIRVTGFRSKMCLQNRVTGLDRLVFWCSAARHNTHLWSQVGKNRSKIFTMNADPATPITTTHITRKKRGRDSEQKRRRRSLACSTHWHTAWGEDRKQPSLPAGGGIRDRIYWMRRSQNHRWCSGNTEVGFCVKVMNSKHLPCGGYLFLQLNTVKHHEAGYPQVHDLVQQFCSKYWDVSVQNNIMNIQIFNPYTARFY